MKLKNVELRRCLERIEDGLNILEDHESEPNEFLAIDEVRKKFETLKTIISQSRGMTLRSQE